MTTARVVTLLIALLLTPTLLSSSSVTSSSASGQNQNGLDGFALVVQPASLLDRSVSQFNFATPVGLRASSDHCTKSSNRSESRGPLGVLKA